MTKHDTSKHDTSQHPTPASHPATSETKSATSSGLTSTSSTHLKKFIIRAPRYVNGTYIPASPENPVEVELPEHHWKKQHDDGTPLLDSNKQQVYDRSLTPADEAGAADPLRPHYVSRDQKPGMAAEHFGPVVDTTKYPTGTGKVENSYQGTSVRYDDKTSQDQRAGKGKRPSDAEPV